MELRKINEDPLQEWIPFEETEAYLNYMLKNDELKAFKEDESMEMEVHNQSKTDYSKVINTVSFFAQSALGKFPKKKKWRIEVWLDERNLKKGKQISCGVALVRPNKTVVYAKKMGENINEAIKNSLNTIEKSVRRESSKLTKDIDLNYAI